MQNFSWLGKAHPFYGGQSALLKVYWFKWFKWYWSSLKQHPHRSIQNNIWTNICVLLVQPNWHIKLTITGSQEEMSTNVSCQGYKPSSAFPGPWGPTSCLLFTKDPEAILPFLMVRTLRNLEPQSLSIWGDSDFRVSQSWVWVQALSHSNCRSTSKFWNLPEPHIAHLQKGATIATTSEEFLGDEKVKCKMRSYKLYPVHSKRSINPSSNCSLKNLFSKILEP